MTPSRAWRLAAVLLLGFGFPIASLAADEAPSSADANADKGTTHSVDASVDYATDRGVGVHAEKQPGAFTIPKGFSGTKLEYEFHNPKSGNTLTKLNGRSIYSLTEHRFMNELDKDPNFQLPPGDYKFVVGGEPGATGRLRYTTVPAPETKPPPKGDVHSVDASVDYPTNSGVGIQAEKQPGTFTIPKGFAGTKLEYEFYNPKSGNTLTKLNGRSIYSLTEHRYMNELDTDPSFQLPPGDYKFVVGGEPGSTGRLRYTTVPAPETKRPPKGPVRTVDASVDYATDRGVGVHAEKQPGSFTIPEGLAGTKLEYEFHNPKSGRTLTKLNGSSIYSVTEHRYMTELDKDPNFQLPPGDYKFVVGGEPGSTGRLRYTEVPYSGPKPPSTTGPKPTSSPTVRNDGRCPHCGEYHNTSSTGGSSTTSRTPPPTSTTARPPTTTTRTSPPWTTRISPPKTRIPPTTTKIPPPPTTKKPPTQTTKKSPPPSSTTRKPPTTTTKTSPPSQTTKKSGPVSLDKNNPNYINNVLKNTPIQKRPN